MKCWSLLLLLLFQGVVPAQQRFVMEGGWMIIDTLSSVDTHGKGMMQDADAKLAMFLNNDRKKLYKSVSPGGKKNILDHYSKNIDSICDIIALYKSYELKPVVIRTDKYITDCFLNKTDTCKMSMLEVMYRFPDGAMLSIAYEDYKNSRFFTYKNYPWHFYGIEFIRKEKEKNVLFAAFQFEKRSKK